DGEREIHRVARPGVDAGRGERGCTPVRDDRRVLAAEYVEGRTGEQKTDDPAHHGEREARHGWISRQRPGADPVDQPADDHARRVDEWWREVNSWIVEGLGRWHGRTLWWQVQRRKATFGTLPSDRSSQP